MTRHTCTRLGLAIVTSEGCEACAAERDGTVSDDAIERIRARWRPEIDLVPVLRGARVDVRTLLAALDESRREVERLREQVEVATHAQRMADAGGIAVRDLPSGAVQASRLIEARDTARRAALEEAASAVQTLRDLFSRMANSPRNVPRTDDPELVGYCRGVRSAWLAATSAAGDTADDLRALIDQPVSPAPVSASEEP